MKRPYVPILISLAGGALFVALLLLGLNRFAPTALAHPVTVDAAGADWTMSAPISTNLGHIARSSAQEGEYIWNDATNDHRTDWSENDQADLVEFRITADSNTLYFFAKMQNITTTSGNGAPMVQVAIDTDRVSGSGEPWLGGLSDTQVNPNAEWEYLLITRFGSGNNDLIVWQNGYTTQVFTGSASISGTTEVIEFSVPWTALEMTEPPILPLRFTVATFRADVSDDTWDSSGNSDAVDAITNYGDPGATLNTWNEVSDGVVDYYFDVWFEADGDPYPPLVVSEFQPNPPGTDSNREWIEIYNNSPISLSLDTVKVGDEETIGGGEGMLQFPTGYSIAPGEAVVVALRADTGSDGFYHLFGFCPDFEINNTTGTNCNAPDMNAYSTWATTSLALNNNDDEVLILDASDTVLDVAGYSDGGYTPYPGVIYLTWNSGWEQSIERRPVYQDTNDCSVDFRVQSTPTPGQASPDLQIAKSGPALAMPGDLIIYTIVYSNSGVADAHSVVITDVLPNGVSYVSDTSGLPCPACSSGIGPSGIITWIVGTLTPTDGISFTLIGQIDPFMPFGSIITNTVEIGTPDAEVTTTNNSSQWVTNISPLDLVVYKWGPMYAFSGETIVYNIVLENRGVATATNVILTDTLPLSTTYVSDDSGWTCPSCIPGAGGVIVWTAGDVPSNTLYTFNLTVTVDAGVPSGMVLTNTVEVSTDTPGDNPANNTDQWETTVYQIVPIATARAGANGEVFAIEGRVTYVPGTYTANGWGLQDASGGIAAFYTPAPTVALGDQVRLVATRGAYQNEEQMVSPVYYFANLGSGPEVSPILTATGAIPAGTTEGWLVQVEGYVSNLGACSGNYSFLVDDGSGAAYIYVDADTGVNVCTMGVVNGDYVRVVGFSTQYQTTYEVKPRRPADVTELYPVTFIYHDLEDVVHSGEAVYLAGNFNGWSPTATPMSANADFSVFSVTVTLSNTGTYEYKYVVYTDTVPSGPANWNWLQSQNRSVNVTAPTTVDDYRNVQFGYVVLQWPSAVTTTVGIPTGNIYGQIWGDDLTSRDGPPRAVLAEVGYGTDPNPANWTAWETMAWNTQSGNNDEFMGVLTPTAAGVYSYVVRFNANWGSGNPNSHWEYGDTDGVHPYDPFEIENAGVLTALAPSLSLTKTVAPDTDVELGSVVTYTITLTNSGDGQAIGVVLTDALPSEVTFGGWVQQNGAVYGSGVITWTGDLAGGTSVTLIFTATVGTDPSLYNRTVTNTASYVSGNAGSGSASAVFTTERRYYIYLPLVMKNYRP